MADPRMGATLTQRFHRPSEIDRLWRPIRARPASPEARYANDSRAIRASPNPPQDMNIAVVGTGYVGLVSGTCFAEMGNQVICVDIDEAKVEKLQSGTVTIFEPGLEVYFDRGIRENRLHFTTDLAEAVEDADVVFLALPTPPADDGSADLQYVLGVADHIGKLLAANPDWGYKVLVDKSTVPVGTARRVIGPWRPTGWPLASTSTSSATPSSSRKAPPSTTSCGPSASSSGCEHGRIFAGASWRGSTSPSSAPATRIIIMDPASAELTKYAANSLLATKHHVHERDRDPLRAGRRRRPHGPPRHRLGRAHRLQVPLRRPRLRRLLLPQGRAGAAPHRPRARATTSASSRPSRVNDDQKTVLIPRISSALRRRPPGKRVAIWGLAFKPNTDDVRESPAHVVIRELVARGAEVVAFDPEAVETTQATFERSLWRARARWSTPRTPTPPRRAPTHWSS